MAFELVIFDLDNTLYPRNSGLLQEIGHRIQTWLFDHLVSSWEEAQAKRREYYERYGTTLGGLIAEHDVDIHDYLRFVHDIPVEAYLAPDPALIRMLDEIPLRKAIYTNAPSEYGRRVLEVLGVNGRFEQLIGIEEVGLRNKPYRDAFERALVLLDVEGSACIIVEDSVRNLRPAKELGLTTVLVDAEPDENVDYVVGSVLEVGALVGELVRGGGRRTKGEEEPMSEFAIDTDTGEELPILVEFAPRPGVRQVSLSMAPEELAGKSALALDRAMSTVRQMAKRVTDAVDKITDKPDKVEVEFGLKLDAEAGAYIAKASTEAGFKVVLTWERPNSSRAGG